MNLNFRELNASVHLLGKGGPVLEVQPFEKVDYNYKYNAKDWQDELGLNVYSMDWRQYDGALGRFVGIDALAETMPSVSPYHFGFNNPTFFADPSGLSPDDYSDFYNSIWNNSAAGTTTTWTNTAFSDGSYGFKNGDGNIIDGSGGFFSDSYKFLTAGTEAIDFTLPVIAFEDFASGKAKQHVYRHSPYYGNLEESESIGQPGDWESIIPVWGSGRAAVDHFQNDWGRGALYTALAMSDLFLVKSLATGLARGGLKLTGSHTWGATRKYYLKNGFAEKGKPLHHWLIHQRGPIGKHIPNSIKNQMWNLKRMPNNAFHQAVHGKGANAFNILESTWYGTPEWVKTTTLSGGGRAIISE